jgi:DDE superfamily endonuclease
LAGSGRPGNRREALHVRGRVRRERLTFAAVRVVEVRGGGALFGATQLSEERYAAFEHEHRENRTFARCRRATTREMFEAYLEEMLVPALRPGRVAAMDNLTAHKGERVREIIEGHSCELLCLSHPIHRTSTSSREPSSNSRVACVRQRPGAARHWSRLWRGSRRHKRRQRPRLLRPLRLPCASPTPMTGALADNRQGREG